MNKVFEVLTEIASTSSRNEKEAILQRHRNNSELLTILKFVYDPYVRTGIGRKKLDKHMQNVSTTIANLNFNDVVNRFANRTGNDTDCYDAACFVASVDAQYRSLMADIICKSLKVGVTSKTLNKVYGDDFIPVIGCMLGTHIDKVVDKHKTGKWVATEKLDGQRKYIVKEHDGTTTIFSGRNGMLDTDYPDIMEQAEKLPCGYVYDGEMIADGEYDDSIAQRQATNSACSKKGNKTGVSLHLFDMVDINGFKLGIDTTPYVHRRNRLTLLMKKLNLANIVNVPVVKVIENWNNDEIYSVVQHIWDKRGEGIMLNRYDAPYEIKRTTSLIKVKFEDSYDLRVTGFKEGTKGTKNEGTLGSIAVSYKGNTVYVAGFSDDLKDEIWNNKEKYLGKICEVRTFGESINNETKELSLNSPVFMGWRDDKDEPDFE